VTPNAREDGDCGSFILDLFDQGAGYMQWKGEITSTQGPFTQASYSGYYDPPLGAEVSVWRPMWVGLTSDWVNTFINYTGSGTVYGGVTAAVDILWWGGVCTLGNPLYEDVFVTG
jgi:hypothetical protein